MWPQRQLLQKSQKNWNQIVSVQAESDQTSESFIYQGVVKTTEQSARNLHRLTVASDNNADISSATKAVS